MDRIAIVGASLAALRAAEELRAQGFDGALHVIGAESHPPYNRPPLSKGLLVGDAAADALALQAVGELDATWWLGREARSLDLRGRDLVLDRDERLAFDGLIIASGSRARPWPGPTPPSGVLTLRTLDDANVLRNALAANPARVLVVGAGFIGSEVASSCRALGLPVSLVELNETPLTRVLGPSIGRFLADVHRDEGVDLRVGVRVRRFIGGTRLRAAELSDGCILEADVAVLALGALHNVEWLSGSGLQVDGGVACGADLRVVGADGVVAAGDVARWPHPLFGGARSASGTGRTQSTKDAPRLEPSWPHGVTPSRSPCCRHSGPTCTACSCGPSACQS